MIVGTTNDPRCLPNDPSGNRRFIPVPCAAGVPATTRTYLDEHRDQMWAEAIHRTRTGKETAYLPDNLAAVQAELAEQFRAVDEVAEEVIGAWLDANPQPVHHERDRDRYPLDPRQPERVPHHDRAEAARLHQVE